MGLQAMTKFASNARYNVDMTVDLNAGNWSKRLTITPDNADVLQIVEAPAGATIDVSAKAKVRSWCSRP